MKVLVDPKYFLKVVERWSELKRWKLVDWGYQVWKVDHEMRYWWRKPRESWFQGVRKVREGHPSFGSEVCPDYPNRRGDRRMSSHLD
jgi:hypothetical protein